jgi:hypothetical protein
MKRFRTSSARGFRLALVFVLLGSFALAGCGASDTVLTPPEGGSKADEAKPKPTKLKKGTSSHRDRENESAK